MPCTHPVVCCQSWGVRFPLPCHHGGSRACCFDGEQQSVLVFLLLTPHLAGGLCVSLLATLVACGTGLVLAGPLAVIDIVTRALAVHAVPGLPALGSGVSTPPTLCALRSVTVS